MYGFVKARLRRATTRFAALAAGAVLAACTKAPPTEVVASAAGNGPAVAYLAAYMTATDEKHLYYALSVDGFRFDFLVNGGKPILGATHDDRRLRDPMILRDRNGIYHLVATVSWTHGYFTIWDSGDLVTWANERLVSVAPAGATLVWAPEIAYDADNDQYFAYWTSATGRFETASIYYATTRDFRTFSAPKLLLSDPKAAIMDASIVYDGARYHMFYRSNGIRHATATHALGPYESPELVANDDAEGPFVFRLIDGSGWGMVWDYYAGNAGFGLLRSGDLSTWERITNTTSPYYNARVSFPVGIRHGSIIGVTQAQVELLRAKGR